MLTPDVKPSDLPPRWPPVLRQPNAEDATYELTSVDASSIAFVTDKLIKVGTIVIVI